MEQPLQKRCILRRPRFFHAIVCLLLTLMAGADSWGQYSSTQWTAESGLPQNSVRGIVQTPDGFIWIATLNGVAKFDGIRFTVFDKSNTPGISTSRFGSMVSGADGDLWLSSEDGNVIRFHKGRFDTLGTNAGLRSHSVAAITTNNRGGLWIDSDDAVYRWVSETGRFEKESFNAPGRQFQPFWWGGTGFWAIQDGQLFCFRRGQLKTLSLPKLITPAQISAVTMGNDGIVWIGLHDGRLGRLIDGSFVPNHGAITTSFRDPDTTAWKVEIAENFTRTLTFPSDGAEKRIAYNIIIRDNERNLWVGSEDKGLFRIQKQSIESISTAQGLASDNVYPVMKARSGDMWIGSWPAGLSRVHNGVVTAFTLKDGVPGLVSALAEDQAGNLWIGSHNGVRIFSDGHFTIPPGMPFDRMPAIQAIYPKKDGTVMLGTPKGIFMLQGTTSHWVTSKEGLVVDDVRVIIGDRRGDIWVGGYGGLTRIHNREMTRWTEQQGLPSNNVRSIHEDIDGDIWVGTYDGGIGWFHDDKWVVFNEARGLYDNGAFQILEDSLGYFWISSNHGIYRVSKKQLKDVAAGRDSSVMSIVYDRADGMLSVECNGGLWPAGAKDDRGFLWFPTQKGVAVVDPSPRSIVNQPPKVVIASVSIEQHIQKDVDHVVLKPGQTNLEVNYTGLSYSRPEQISFRYKLDGADKEWQKVGQRRTAYYSHLPPGEYVFRVSATNRNGVVSDADGMLMVSVIPPFYWRWWFIAAVAFAVLSVIWMLWKYRVKQLKTAQAAQQTFSQQLIASQESDRRRIAAELHDSLGQRLIIIKNLALFLLRPKGKIRSEEDKMEVLEEISAEASHAIEETRAISYDLRPFQLDRLGLSRAIQALVKTVAHAAQIELTAEIADIDDEFPEDQRINVYRIVQEALNNIVKHSGATRGCVIATRAKSSIVLMVSDNGKGFPTEPRSMSAGPGGFGLTGIRERATLLKGTLHIQEEPGAGTLLTIDFPVVREQQP